MFKFGVYRQRDLCPSDLETKWGRRKFVAMTLYPEISRLTSPDRDSLLELILCRFAGAKRIFKRTHRARFPGFDRELVALISQLHADRRPYRVHDVAVSNGITAVDFYRQLKASRRHLEYVASDFAPDLLAINQQGERLTLVLDPVTHDWLQIVYPPFVFNLQKRENEFIYPFNGLVRRWLERTSCRRLWDRYCAGQQGIRTTTIRLLHPECQQLLQRESDFAFQRCDILQPMEGRFDLVRAMNILNPAYFAQRDLQRAIRNIHGSLTCGGLLATGSNQDSRSPVAGAIYRQSDGGFERLRVSGAGSPVDAMITQFRRAASFHRSARALVRDAPTL